ncbi:hypothetical protein EDM80_03595 [bacterium]|nr:MAG: hypothetical protein EDM80_03595 [bacterium]RIK64138.1 MAG: hypothetical protein DCC64_05345 [Planctomycetota bacterium]
MAMLGVLVAVLSYTAFATQWGIDEILFYGGAVQKAAETWPALETNPYATAPAFFLWLWCIPAKLGAEPVIGARCISLACFALGAGLAISQRRNIELIVWLNPWVIVYAVRAHPLVGSMLLLTLALRCLERRPWLAAVLFALSAHFQVYMAGVTCALAWVHLRSPWKSRLAAGAMIAAAVAGAASNLLLWGGRVPQALQAWIEPMIAARHGIPVLATLPMIPVAAGAYLWFFRGKIELWRLTAAGLAVWLVAFLERPAGPIDVASKFLPAHAVWWCLAWVAIAAGWVKAGRGANIVLVSALAAAAVLSNSPFSNERVACFASYGPVILASHFDSTHEPRSLGWWLFAAVCVAAGFVYHAWGAA